MTQFEDGVLQQINICIQYKNDDDEREVLLLGEKSVVVIPKFHRSLCCIPQLQTDNSSYGQYLLFATTFTAYFTPPLNFGVIKILVVLCVCMQPREESVWWWCRIQVTDINLLTSTLR